MDAYLHNLARYDAWANRLLLESIASLPAPDERVAKLLAHLMVAKETWLARIEGTPRPPVDLWPALGVPEASARLARADAALIALLRGRADLHAPIHYRTTRGEPFTTPLDQILVHLVNHGTYHRGQLATAVKNAGGTPAATDYILYVRTLPGSQG